MGEITRILNAFADGEGTATADLLPIVYNELRRLAAAKLANEAVGLSLQATDLVHEAYLRLTKGEQESQWNSPRHFFGAAAEAMRRILVENARHKNAVKHGGGIKRVDLETACPVEIEPSEDVLALHEALEKLAMVHPVKAELVMLRYFGGLSQARAAEVLDISTTTADRYWSYARAWLYREISGDSGEER